MKKDTASYLLRMEKIAKHFGGIKALQGVNLNLESGKVMALIGENGAGKSTLVKILTGIYQPDEGSLFLENQEVFFNEPYESRNAGISAIHQETVMFKELSVTENIFMGHHLKKNAWLLDWPRMNKITQGVLDRLEVDFSPESRMSDLSVAQKHVVQIAKALTSESKIVIMDEPTSSLSQREIQDLYKIIRQLKEEGKAILFISHKFDEIFAIADNYTVLRDGEYVDEGKIEDVNEDDLIRLMVGRTLDKVFPKIEVEIGPSVLEVEQLSHETEFEEISFSLKKGEILGFYGLVGAGRSEVMKAIFGVTEFYKGSIKLNGKQTTISSPKDAIGQGIAYVPEDRKLLGALLDMTITENISLPLIDKIMGGILLSPKKEEKESDFFGEKLSIKAHSWGQNVSELSGGNQQKVVLAKWLSTKPKILILDEPTKGIDVGSKAAVHEFMGELAKEGLAVIMVSSELPEILGMSDRIIVMHNGLISKTFKREDATPESVLAAATGSDSQFAA
ncbi:MAG: sugar ABC transporter ATP-binding protein [Proteobacteria bacterium]|nr:sugar ABC transporter ATP-binding protein [Pseudomonadota bacterium]